MRDFDSWVEDHYEWAFEAERSKDPEERARAQAALDQARGLEEDYERLQRVYNEVANSRARLQQVDSQNPSFWRWQKDANRLAREERRLDRQVDKLDIAQSSPLFGEVRNLRAEMEAYKADFKTSVNSRSGLEMGSGAAKPSGEGIRGARIAMGMSQTQFAQYLRNQTSDPVLASRITQQTISHIERSSAGRISMHYQPTYEAIVQHVSMPKGKAWDTYERAGRDGMEARYAWEQARREIRYGAPSPETLSNFMAARGDLDTRVLASEVGVDARRLENYAKGSGTLKPDELSAVGSVIAKEWHSPDRPQEYPRIMARWVDPQSGKIVTIRAYDEQDEHQKQVALGDIAYNRTSMELAEDNEGNMVEVDGEEFAKMVEDLEKRGYITDDMFGYLLYKGRGSSNSGNQP